MIQRDYSKAIATTDDLLNAAMRIYDDAKSTIRARLCNAERDTVDLREQMEDAYCDPSRIKEHDALSSRYDAAKRRYDAIRDLADALDTIDRWGNCYYLAKLIAVHGKADGIISHIKREHARQIASGDCIIPICEPQDIKGWSIDHYCSLINDLLSFDEKIAFSKSIWTCRKVGDIA